MIVSLPFSAPACPPETGASRKPAPFAAAAAWTSRATCADAVVWSTSTFRGRGGAESDFARAGPVVNCYARAVTLLGGPGSGQLAKMVNQICIAGMAQALAEGISFAEKAGLDALAVLDVIGKGAAQSWQMDNRGKTMVADQFDFGFAVDWMRKDLGICLAEARANGAQLPVTALVDQFYARLQAEGGGRRDTSSLIRLLRKPK